MPKKRRAARAVADESQECKHPEEPRRFSCRLLAVANRHTEMQPMLEDFVREIRAFTGCDAAAIRLLDEDGNIPFVVSEGAAEEFLARESPLSVRCDECYCIDVIQGHVPSGSAPYTEAGSLYVNDGARFMQELPEEEKSRLRGVCFALGHKSLALIPIRIEDRIVGLIHVADHREGVLPREVVEIIEHAGLQLGIAVERVRLTEQLRAARDELERRVRQRTADLTAANEKLRRQIAEREDTERALRLSEARLAEAQRIAHLGNWEWDIEKDEVWWSDEIYRTFGVRREDFAHTYKAFLRFVHPEDRAFVDGSVERALYDRAPCNIHYRVVRSDGDVRTVHEIGVVTFDEAGRPIRMVGTLQDITDRVEVEEARDAAERELADQQALSMRADRLRSLGEMAAGIAHELNQPLLGVRGMAQHLLIALDRQWELPTKKLRDRLQKIIEQTDRMSHIIQHVRTFAKEAGRPELLRVDVNEVIKSAMGMVEAQFRSRGIALEAEFAESLPAVLANPFSLEEVIINLLLNARDAVEERLRVRPMPEGPRVVARTAVRRFDSGPSVRVEVTDNGAGVPEDILPRVFDPFFTTKGPGKGTGLGLSVARALVEQFGGTIEVESDPGKWTTVRFFLPPAPD